MVHEQEMKTFIEYLVKSLVESPDAVTVTAVPGEKTTVFELRVAKGDLGKVIGKQGRTARSIRVLLNAAATRGGKRAILEILDV